MYTHPALEYLLHYSDIVVHASLASVTIRTTSLPRSRSRFDEAEIPPGKKPAPACMATLDLRFDVDEYLMGTGPTEVLVEIPLMRTYYLKDGLLHFLHLKQETEADAVTWWSTKSPLWDTRKAVLFLKFGDDDDKTLSFTDKGFAPTLSSIDPKPTKGRGFRRWTTNSFHHLPFMAIMSGLSILLLTTPFR